jgi:succinate dehydrogenase / fumarate reductase cytochrome b subunit
MTSALDSSTGKKLGMAVTGLILYGFLVGHLAGNLLLVLPDDGGAAFNEYAAYLESHPQIVLPSEAILVLSLVLHVYCAVSLSRSAAAARPVGYRRLQSVGGRSLASRTMIWSGLVIFIFLFVHIGTFKFGDRMGGTLYDLVAGTFQQGLWAAGYVLVMALLGFHLWHALGSAFQTLGLAARPKLRRASAILCLVLAGGFAAIPAAMFLGGN